MSTLDVAERCGALLAHGERCTEPVCNLNLLRADGQMRAACYVHARMQQSPHNGPQHPWRGSTAQESKANFMAHIRAGGVLPKVVAEDKIATNAARAAEHLARSR